MGQLPKLLNMRRNSSDAFSNNLTDIWGGPINKINMIGSLAEFIDIDQTTAFPGLDNPRTDKKQNYAPALSKRRGKSTFESYTPDDKTDLLVRYEKNNLYNVNRQKFNSLAKEAVTKQQLRKPLYQHRSFFVKPEVAKDYIAKDELKRKHNLLRAILRMKQNQEQPNKQSDYEQSFQRLYSGFRSIYPQPVLQKKEQLNEEEQLIQPNIPISVPEKRRNGLDRHKRLEFERCLSWAKKHQKNGDFFAEQLGKGEKQMGDESPVMNRSLLQDIGKKVNVSWLQ